MTARLADVSPAEVNARPPWTCPFCPLLCDGFGVEAATLRLVGSDCARAQQALAQFGSTPSDAQPTIDARPGTLDTAIAAAAAFLAAGRQPLFAGMGCDVAGARALYALAAETGAICDSAQGAALMQGLRALQDKGAFTTTLAEVRTRADVIVCFGGAPSLSYPEFFRRCGVHETVLPRHIVIVGEAPAGSLAALDGLAGVSVEVLPLPGDLFTAASVLAALVAERNVRDAPPGLVALAQRLRAAHYAVLVWESSRFSGRKAEHGALAIEALNRVVASLNLRTRAATLPLGGADGSGTVNQVFTWLSGLPMRSRPGPAGLEHEPTRFDTERLLADASVDVLLWVSSFGAGSPPPPAGRLPRIVLGHPGLAEALGAPGAGACVFIPVSTPGIGSSGHLFRTDTSVLMPLHAVRPDGLPTVADVVGRITSAVKSLRAEDTS